MKLAIMQPYFIPYIGYFQLISSVDKFVVYDNIKYTKKGWINRNRILLNGKDDIISLPIKKDSDFLDINQRFLSENFKRDKDKILSKVYNSYLHAPYFKEVFNIFQNVMNHNEQNLFSFIFNSINVFCNYLNIKTEIIISSEIVINYMLKSEEKVIAICENLSSDIYVNPIGGTELYSKENFRKKNIELFFLKSDFIHYKQFNNEFIPWLSILDILMFNNVDKIRNEFLPAFSLI